MGVCDSGYSLSKLSIRGTNTRAITGCKLCLEALPGIQGLMLEPIDACQPRVIMEEVAFPPEPFSSKAQGSGAALPRQALSDSGRCTWREVKLLLPCSTVMRF